MKSSKLVYRPDIDGLRALAILPVVFFHIGIPWLDAGFIGVDIFFVISGFLITEIVLFGIRGGDFSIIHFYERRIRRILPVYFIVVLVSLVAGYFILLPMDLRPLGTSSIASLAFISNIFFYKNSGYFAEPSETKPLLHTWSLSVEEQFYLFLPALLILTYKYKRLLIPIVILTFFGSFLHSVKAAELNPSYAFYMIQTRAWELLLGSSLSIFNVNRLKAYGWTRYLTLCGLTLISTGLFLIDKNSVFPGYNAIYPCLGAAFVIAGGGNDRLSKIILQNGLAVFIGKISYSLYMWHWPVIVYWRYVNLGELNIYSGIICISIALSLSVLTYFVVEKPFRNSSLMQSRKLIFGFSLAGVSLLTVVSVLARLDNGHENRLSPELIKLFDEYQLDATNLCMISSGDEDCNKKANVLLLGDSHSEALAPAINKRLSEIGAFGLQITGPGYRPLIGYTQFGFQNRDRFYEGLIQKACTERKIDNVIVVGYWLDAVNSTYLERQTLTEVSGHVAVRNGLEKLTEICEESRIILVQDIPVSKKFGKKYSAKMIWFGRYSEQKIVADEFYAQYNEYEDAFSYLEVKKNVHVLELGRDMCDSKYCYSVINDKHLYRDNDHLSTEGAVYLAGLNDFLLQ